METTQTILEGDSGQPPEQVQPLRPTQLAKENSQSRSNRLDPMPSDSDKIAGTEQHNAQEAQPPTLSADGPEGKTTQDGGNDNSESNEPYSLFTDTEKRFAIMIASFAALISPLAGSTYYPSLNSLADNYGVSISDITLSITIFQIFQGIAPSFTGDLSDRVGRRPAYIICFTTFLGANIGLALQNSYAALMVLRCLQSFGSSGTIAIGSAVVADLVTRAERGKFIAYATLGVTLGPALGPLIGGILNHFLGWRAVFWFLAIVSGVTFLLVLITLPETCRDVVGNGSIRPPKWNYSLIQYLRRDKGGSKNQGQHQGHAGRRRRLNPFAALRIVLEREAGILLLFGGLFNVGYFFVLSTLSPQLEKRYGYNSLQVGLCYLPIGFGSLTARNTVGMILDWNFRRHAKKLGIEIVKNRQQDLSKFPIERVRLQVSLPYVFLACATMCTFGWVMDYRTSVAGPLVLLFFVGHFTAGTTMVFNVLIVDLYKDSPATAVAANNLVRCLLAAGALSVANPCIKAIGIGWTSTLVAFLWLFFSPTLWAVMRWGAEWRRKSQKKEKVEDEKRRRADPEAAAEMKPEPA